MHGSEELKLSGSFLHLPCAGDMLLGPSNSLGGVTLLGQPFEGGDVMLSHEAALGPVPGGLLLGPKPPLLLWGCGVLFKTL